MPTVGQCEREIEKLKQHVVELNKLKQSRHELTSMFKEASALFGEYTESICNAIGEAVQKLDKQITLLEDPLFVVGESLESLPNQIVAEKQKKHENENSKILAQEPEKHENSKVVCVSIRFTLKQLQDIQEHYRQYPALDYLFISNEGNFYYMEGATWACDYKVIFRIPDLLKEHGL
ncbi:MAG: hypothetical protein HF309_18110 [Ignavibacteria bacterium]|nr:hypothetical protein [Ignavibacteria bacterium]